MKDLYLAIKKQLQSTISSDGSYDPSFDESFDNGVPIEVYQYNSRQLKSLLSKTEEGNEGFPQNFPCILIEFKNTRPAQLGGGVKCYDDLQVLIHYLYREEVPLEGDLGESLEVFPFSDSIRLSLEGWYSMMLNIPGSGIFTWNDSHEDEEFDNIYHLVHEFGTTWMDTVTQGPVDYNNTEEVAAQTVPQPIKPIITTKYNPPPFTKPLP